MSIRPVVVVSRCLGFADCRYDGSRVLDGFVDRLRGNVRYVKVCPEVEIGMGTPRPPIRIVEDGDKTSLIQPATGKDFLPAMEKYTRKKLDALGDVDGFILKSRSPSCGAFDVKIYPPGEKVAGRGGGTGIFARGVLERFPFAAIEDEGRLTNLKLREHFLIRLFLRARFRKLKQRPSMKGLVAFHSDNKFLLMGQNQARMRALGKTVANHEKLPVKEVFEAYEAGLSEATAKPARPGSMINVAMHALGHVSEKLEREEKNHFLAVLEDYRAGTVPLPVVNVLLQSWIRRFKVEYLARQSFFEPYPRELIDPTDSGVKKSFR